MQFQRTAPFSFRQQRIGRGCHWMTVRNISGNKAISNLICLFKTNIFWSECWKMAFIHFFAQLNLMQWRLPDVLRQYWHAFWLFCKTLLCVDGLNIDLGLHMLPDAGVAWFKVWRSSWPMSWASISNPLNFEDFIQKFSYLTLRVWAGVPTCMNMFLCSSGTSCRRAGNAYCKNWWHICPLKHVGIWYNLINLLPITPIDILTENCCWWLECLNAKGFLSSHMQTLWKLKIPSFVKHASSGQPKPDVAVSWRHGGAFSDICSLELCAVCLTLWHTQFLQRCFWDILYTHLCYKGLRSGG
jgi:hypothetical protein